MGNLSALIFLLLACGLELKSAGSSWVTSACSAQSLKVMAALCTSTRASLRGLPPSVAMRRASSAAWSWISWAMDVSQCERVCGEIVFKSFTPWSMSCWIASMSLAPMRLISPDFSRVLGLMTVSLREEEVNMRCLL